MKLVDSIHLAAKDPKAAKDIASSYYLAIVVDAGILVALIFGAVWLLDSVATVIPGGSDIASKVLVIFLFTMVIGGGIFTLIRTVLHAIPICINTANQIRGIVPEDVNNNVDSPNNDTGGTEEEVAAEETLISLFTNRVKDKDGLEKGMTGHPCGHIKLQMTVMAKNLLLEEYPLAEKEIVRKTNFWVLDVDVNDYTGACRFYVGLADQIKIIDSPEFEAYVDEYLQKCFPIIFVPKSTLDNIDGNI